MAFIIRGFLGGITFGFMFGFLAVVALSWSAGEPLVTNAQNSIMIACVVIGGAFGILAGFEANVNRRHIIFGDVRSYHERKIWA